jgi:hypothetical protein
MVLSFTASFCVEEYIVEIVKSNFTLVRLIESFDLHGFISFIHFQQDLCMALAKQSVETLKGAFHEKLIDISLYGSLSVKFALLSKLYSRLNILSHPLQDQKGFLVSALVDIV